MTCNPVANSCREIVCQSAGGRGWHDALGGEPVFSSWGCMHSCMQACGSAQNEVCQFRWLLLLPVSNTKSKNMAKKSKPCTRTSLSLSEVLWPGLASCSPTPRRPGHDDPVGIAGEGMQRNSGNVRISQPASAHTTSRTASIVQSLSRSLPESSPALTPARAFPTKQGF